MSTQIRAKSGKQKMEGQKLSQRLSKILLFFQLIFK